MSRTIRFWLLLLGLIQQSRTSEEIDFRCIYVYAERVECTWEADNNCGNWTFTYGKEKYGNFTPDKNYSCTEQLEERVLCQQLVGTTGCYSIHPPCLNDNETYIFNVHGTCMNQSVNESFTLPLNETYLKIEPVTDLAVINSTIDSMVVKWTLLKSPSFYESNEVVCSLNFQSINQNVSITKESRVATGDLQFVENYWMNAVVNKLFPGTTYTITVKCRPLYSVVWSDKFHIETMTKYTVPLIRPLLSSNGFMRGKDYILVYFKIPPSSRYKEQGNVSAVKIEFGSTNSNYVLSTNIKTAYNLTAIFKTCWLQIGGELKIKARTRNQVGLSKTYSEEQYHLDEALPVPGYITVEFNKTSGGFYIRQEHDNSPSVNFTYFWCIGSRNTRGEVICRAELQWSDSDKNSFNGSIPFLYVRKNWHFGIAASAGKTSSGIKWENCIFYSTKKDTEPNTPYVIISETYVHVMIPRKYCRSDGYRPLYYNVEYSPPNGEPNRTRIPALSTTTNVTLYGLIPDTSYNLTYYEEYNYGKGPNKSINVRTVSTEKQKSYALNVVHNVVIPCVVLIGLILLGVIIFKCRKQIKDLFSIPEIQTMEIKTSKPFPAESDPNHNKDKHIKEQDQVKYIEIHTDSTEKLGDYTKVELGSGSSTGTTSSENSLEEDSPLLKNILSQLHNAVQKGDRCDNFELKNIAANNINSETSGQAKDGEHLSSYVRAKDLSRDKDKYPTEEIKQSSSFENEPVSSYVRTEDISPLFHGDINITTEKDQDQTLNNEPVSSYVQTGGMFDLSNGNMDGSKMMDRRSSQNASGYNRHITSTNDSSSDIEDQNLSCSSDTSSACMTVDIIPIVSSIAKHGSDDKGQGLQINEVTKSSLPYVSADDFPTSSSIIPSPKDKICQSSSRNEENMSSYVCMVDMFNVSCKDTNENDFKSEEISESNENVASSAVRTDQSSFVHNETIVDSSTLSEEHVSSCVCTANLFGDPNDESGSSNGKDSSIGVEVKILRNPNGHPDTKHVSQVNDKDRKGPSLDNNEEQAL